MVVGVLQRGLLAVEDVAVVRATRIEATTGLQTSQPSPLPCPSIRAEKDVIPVARTIS